MDLNECIGFGCFNFKGRLFYRELFGILDISKECFVSWGMECSRLEFKDIYMVCIVCLRILLCEYIFFIINFVLCLSIKLFVVVDILIDLKYIVL